MLTMKTFSKEQKKLLDSLSLRGHGYTKYANSVRKQGYCTEAQYETMLRLLKEAKAIEQSKVAHRRSEGSQDYSYQVFDWL